MKLHYHMVELTDDYAMTFIGGPLKAGSAPGKVFITNPKGEALFEVDALRVTEITRKKLEEILVEDLRRNRAK